MLLDALEAGCVTRKQIFDHQGCFALLNNAAAELRAAGIPVGHSYEDKQHCYRLLSDDGRPSTVPQPSLPAPVIAEQSGQLTWDVAA